MQRGYENSRSTKFSGRSSQGGYEDRRGTTGGYEDRRGAGINDRGGGSRSSQGQSKSSHGFEVRREAGYEERRSAPGHSHSHRQSHGHGHQSKPGDRDVRMEQAGSSNRQAPEPSYTNGRQQQRHDRERREDGGHRPHERDKRDHGGHQRDSRRDQADPWSSWQRSKSNEPPSKKDRRESDAGTSRDRVRDRGGRVENRNDRKYAENRRDNDKADRDRRERNEEERRKEDRKKREEAKKLEERRRTEERRLEEIKRREQEIRQEEEKLRRKEEQSRRDELRRQEEDRRRELERERERRNARRRESPNPRVYHNSPPRSSNSRRGRSPQRRSSSDRRQTSSRRRSSSSSRKSALDRLGPKVPVVTRLGAGKVSRKRRRPGSKERSEVKSEKTDEDKDNMQITIAGGDTNETVGSSRKVARDVDIENFTVLDQVGEEDGDKTEATSKPEQNQNKTSIKNEEPVDLEKVVIKRREKKDDRKSTDGKDLIVKKPSSLISKLAKRKQTMSSSQLEEKEMTDQERSEIRKRCKAKYAEEEKVTEKVISMAMDLSQFDESETCQLIDSILKEELEETGEENCNSIKDNEAKQVSSEEDSQSLHLENNTETELASEDGKVTNQIEAAAPVQSVDDGHDQLDFEAEDTEEQEKTE